MGRKKSRIKSRTIPVKGLVILFQISVVKKSAEMQTSFTFSRHICRAGGLNEIHIALPAGRYPTGKGVTGNGGV